MRDLTTEQARIAVGGCWLTRPGPAAVLGVSIDSRTARAGDLFITISGENFDGHQFLRQAGEAGCVGAIVDRDRPPTGAVAELFSGGIVGVRDTRRALGDLAAWHRRRCRTSVMAVTGSNGKTTVKRMIHHILSRQATGSCSRKSFNNDIGVPLSLLDVGCGDDYVVCEVGSSGPGEVLRLARICGPDVAVITNIGPTHLEKLGSIERVAAEKASLLAGLKPGGLAVVWGDSELLRRAAGGYDARQVYFGTSDACDLRVTGFESDGPRQRFQLNGRIWVDLPLPGRHNAVNALAAIATAQRFGVSQDDAAAALGDFEAVEMRLEWIDAGCGTIVNDAYNANPDSVLAGALAIAACKARRRVMIVGDMRELGDSAEQLHRQTGRRIAATAVHLLIGVGAMGGLIAESAAQEGMAGETFASVDEALRKVPSMLAAGDLVLVKGSRAMAMERLIDPIRAAFERIAAAGQGLEKPGQ